MLFHERLKQARSLAGLTQEAAAKLIGVHKITYLRWEKSRPPKNIDYVQRAAAAFGVSQAWLASGDGPVVLAQSNRRSA